VIARRSTAAVAMCLAALVGCSSGDDASSLPDVEINALTTGEASSLADIDGPAVINLWATWCAPCRREIPDFEEVHLARGDVIRFVGINVGEDASQAAEFLDDLDVTYDQFTDPEGYVVTELDATAMPVTIVIDADEAITLRHLGPLDQDGLNEAIDDALAG
jgi:thiol-disulfide isomerase/thioredoxin